MKLQCPGCQVAFSVPDEKIPRGKGLRILCPKCKTPIQLANREEMNEKADETLTFDPSTGVAEELSRDDMYLLDVVEEGERTALVCVSDDSRWERVEEVLRQLGFYVIPADTVSFALAKIHHNSYDLILVDESFDGAGQSGNLVLHHVRLLPMHLRRHFFLCLLSESLPSLDHLAAFRIGVDMILNLKDLERGRILLDRAIKDHQVLYKVFQDELAKKGQL